MTKKLTIALYILTIVCMGLATVVEKYQGTAWTAAHIYGALWFALLWASLTLCSTFLFIRSLRINRGSLTARLPVSLLHLSFVVTLLGALLTSLTSRQGILPVRQGETGTHFFIGQEDDRQACQLPFQVKLTDFSISYHSGTDAPSDYHAWLEITGHEGSFPVEVSMNNICRHHGYRFYLSDYAPDGKGVTLTVNHDPWGIPVTYTGYAMMLLGLVLVTVCRRTARDKGKPEPACAPIRVWAGTAAALLTVSVAVVLLTDHYRQPAQGFEGLYILHQDRICPIETFALDFTRKLCGSSSFEGHTATEVVQGFLFRPEQWNRKAIIKIPDGELRDALQLPRYCSLNTFFNADMGGYILGPYLRESGPGPLKGFCKDVQEVDDKLMMLMQIRNGELLKVLPDEHDGITKWETMKIKPGDIPWLNNYQRKNSGGSLPGEIRTAAERLYNRIPFTSILFITNLVTAFGWLGYHIRRKASSAIASASPTLHYYIPLAVVQLTFALLSACLALRWTVSGTIPMSNGYETMLAAAWLLLLTGLAVCHRQPIVLPFSLLMSGFFLLVSHLGQMSPDISHTMPVLNSPLLCIHVSIVMLAYALFSITFVSSLSAIVTCRMMPSTSPAKESLQERLYQLNNRLLLPAVALLAVGIFTGAVWANISWGRYWSWDPKETWALITLMVYAAPLHRCSLPRFRQPLFHHLYVMLAFVTILMTYLGVNYILGGMHAYA